MFLCMDWNSSSEILLITGLEFTVTKESMGVSGCKLSAFAVPETTIDSAIVVTEATNNLKDFLGIMLSV